jgi:hypothetical protein
LRTSIGQPVRNRLQAAGVSPEDKAEGGELAGDQQKRAGLQGGDPD